MTPKTAEGPRRGPSEYDSPKSMTFYFFFDAFFVFFPPFFFVAIMLTTFHAVRDLTVALIWQSALDRSSTIKGSGRRDGQR